MVEDEYQKNKPVEEEDDDDEEEEEWIKWVIYY